VSETIGVYAGIVGMDFFDDEFYIFWRESVVVAK
jgi:hypothetical protein